MNEKKKRDELERNYLNNGVFEDANKNYEQNIIEQKRQQREINTNEAIINLAKINSCMNSKEKLIKLNENSTNPLFDYKKDYKLEKYQDEYEKRQKMINDNINMYANNERPEITSYYDHYVYNPKYPQYDNNNNENPTCKTINKEEYIKALQEQIDTKNELKKKEKEEQQKIERQRNLKIKEQIEKEEKDKILKERRQKEELIKANMDLINQKNKLKQKELEEKLRYRDLYETEDSKYKANLINEMKKKEKIRKEMLLDNLNKIEQQKRNKEKEYLDDMKFRHLENSISPQKERMGRCCKCHKIFPRRLLSINRYFYKENRIKK